MVAELEMATELSPSLIHGFNSSISSEQTRTTVIQISTKE